MISKEIICLVKKDKFIRALKEIKSIGAFAPYYSFVIYFRYKDFIKCTTNQEEKDRAYISLHLAKGSIFAGLILGIIYIIMGVGVILAIIHNSSK